MQTQTHAGERRSATKAARAPKSKQARGKRLNAISLLKQDHEKVSTLFEKFEKSGHRMSDGAKQKLAEQICTELSIHTQIEEEIFYPRIQGAFKGADDLVAEARVEHKTLKRLIADIGNGRPGDENYDAYVRVLGEYVEHHVKEEHTEMFPKVRKSKIDIAGLGDELMRRKQELMGKAGVA